MLKSLACTTGRVITTATAAEFPDIGPGERDFSMKAMQKSIMISNYLLH
jgi:hypothetical protein